MRPSFWAMPFVWIVLVMMSSCTTGGSGTGLEEDDDDDGGLVCSENTDCDPGLVCEDGHCVVQQADGDQSDGDQTDGDQTDGDGNLPKLIVPATVDFGSVPIGASAEKSFEIGNDGQGDLILTSLEFDRATSGEFVILEGPESQAVVRPGESLTVRLSYTPVDVEEDSGLLVLVSNDPTNPAIEIALITGYKGTPTLVANPESVSFPLTEIGQTAQSVTVTLTNEMDEDGNRAIEITDIYLESRSSVIFDLGNLPTGEILVTPAQPITFDVLFHPNNVDSFSDAIIIEADSGIEGENLRLPLSGEGGAGRVDIQPGSMNFGALDLDDSFANALLVRNVGSYDLTIREVTVSGSMFSLESVTPEADAESGEWILPPGNSLSANVVFNPTEAGDHNGQLVVRSTDPLQPTATATLSGSGQTPGLVLTPTNLSFTDTRLGESNEKSLSVKKESNFVGDVSIVSVTLQEITLDDQPYSGEPAFEFLQAGSLPLVLADETEHNWTFRFTAQSEGLFEAQAILETDPEILPAPTISLSGLGVSPHLTPSVDGGMPLDFGQVRLGESQSRNLMLTNTGTTTLTIASIGLSDTTPEVYSLTAPASTSFTLSPSQTQTITVKLTLADGDPTGETLGSLIVQSDDPDHPSLSWPLNATAINPKLLVLPAHDPFFLLGNVPLNAVSDTVTFTIRPDDLSFGPLEITEISLPAANDAGYTFLGLSGLNFPIVLNQATPESSSLSFQVFYTARQEGSFWADVEIETNDLSNPFHTVRLKTNVTSCEASQILCNNQCVTANTPDHCIGDDGCSPCPDFPGRGTDAEAQCVVGDNGQSACVVLCTDGTFGDCNGEYDDGCEVNLNHTTEHCGECDNACPSPELGEAICQLRTCDVSCPDDTCKVDGNCVASGSLNPENSCELCDPTQSTSAYSMVDDSNTCDDGLYCTVLETCSAGACLNGAPRDCSSLVSLTSPDCQIPSCNEDSDTCEITPANEGGDCSQDGEADGWVDTGDLGPGCADVNDPIARYLDYSCSEGSCLPAESDSIDCNQHDGIYGGGNTPGCGTDPDWIIRDYYADESGQCVFSTEGCSTGDCDAQDICSPVCDGTRRVAYLDAYATENSDQCTTVFGDELEDCPNKTSTDSDGAADAYLVGGTVIDYNACEDGICIGQTRTDYCIGSTLYEYGADGTGIAGPSLKNCGDFDTFYCDATGRFLYRDTYTCAGTPGACSNIAVDTLESDCGTSTCIGACGSGENGCMYNQRGCAGGQCVSVPQDADTDPASCTGCAQAWNLGGDVSPTTCCGDDSNEKARTCQDSSNNGQCGTDTQACCATTDHCVDHTGACQESGACLIFGSGGQKSYCQQGVWQDPDESEAFCEDASCGFDWLANVPGGMGCCGDDPGEDLEQNAGAGRSCCYNGSLLVSGSAAGSILCYSGQLYDCNNAASDDSDLATAKQSCDSVGTMTCTPTNTWMANKPDGCSCEENTDCQSNACRSDYDGIGKWCAGSGQCVHDGQLVNHGSYSPDCYDSNARALCNNGLWSVSSCGADSSCTDFACEDGSCVENHFDSNTRCNTAFACSPGPGNNNYGDGGTYSCQGYCDGAGNCDYADSCESCSDSFPGASVTCNGGTCSMTGCLSGYADCDSDPSDCESLEVGGSCADDSIDIGSVDTNLYENTALFCSTKSCETGPSRTGRGERWYKIRGKNDTGCDDGNKLWVRLQSPAGMDYDLYLYTACGTQVDSSRLGTGSLDEVTYHWADYDRYMWIEVRYYSGSNCSNWTLSTKGGCPSGW